jgi:hypothetical protein
LVVSEPVGPGPASRIDVTGGEAAPCIDPTRVRTGIAETLAFSLPNPTDEPDLSLRVELRRVHEGFEADVELHGRRGGTRSRSLQIELDECQELLNAVVLVSALLLDDLWTEERQRPEAPPDPPRTLDVPVTAPTPPRPRWSVFTGIDGVFAYGDLPGPNGAVALKVEFAPPKFVSFGIRALVWPRATARDESGRGGRFSAYDGGAFVCARAFERGRVQLLTCLGARGGVTYATGLGLSDADAEVRPRVLVDAGFGGRVHLHRPLWLDFGIGLAVPLIRDHFQYRDENDVLVTVHRSWPVVPMIHLGLELAATLGRSS